MAKKETNKKENTKNKRSFSKDFKAELKKVVWQTPKQLVNSTVAVITIVLITALIVFVLDLAFEAINKQGINKVKQVINTNNSVSSENTANELSEESTESSEAETTEKNNSEDNNTGDNTNNE